MFAAVETARGRVRRGGISPSAYVDPGTIVHELRLRKDAEELETMRRAAAITRLGHLAGMRATRPGLHEYELQAVIEHAYRAAGAQGLAYESIVAGGDNATILHYVANRERLRAGDLVLVDSAAELDCYASDVTRTLPVGGRFSGEQRALYEIVLAAQKAAIAEVRPGAHVKSVARGRAARADRPVWSTSACWPVPVEDALANETYKPFYPHSHRALDRPRRARRRRVPRSRRHDPAALEPGMVFTVEPGLYVAARPRLPTSASAASASGSRTTSSSPPTAR